MLGDIVGGYMLHPDSVPGCSIHPRQPLVANSSGQRYPEQVNDAMEEDLITENSLKIWNFGNR